MSLLFYQKALYNKGMIKYRGEKEIMSVLNGVLSKEHKAHGLEIELGETYVLLFQRNVCKAKYDPKTVQLETIIAKADELVNWDKSGIEFGDASHG